MSEDPCPLIGEAVGDSLGMAFETQPAESEALRAWDGSYQGSDYHQLKPGQWTDDTMMAKILAESLSACGGYFPRDVADRYLVWLKSNQPRGMGKTTRAALERLAEGSTWLNSGIPGAEGNGSAMRAAPLGFYYREDVTTAREFARMDARITHLSLEAEMGSAAVAVAVALLSEKEADRSNLLPLVAEYLDDCRVQRQLLHVFDLIESKLDLGSVLREVGTKAHVVQTVPAAFAAFCMTDSYVDAVQTAIRAGGDTDTTAAIAGALAGTFYGLGAIPKAYLTTLEGYAHLRRIETKIARGPRGDLLWKLD